MSGKPNPQEIGELRENAARLKLLNRMDVEGSGNAGWEGRILWFLSELVTQAEQHGRTHP